MFKRSLALGRIPISWKLVGKMLGTEALQLRVTKIINILKSHELKTSNVKHLNKLHSNVQKGYIRDLEIVEFKNDFNQRMDTKIVLHSQKAQIYIGIPHFLKMLELIIADEDVDLLELERQIEVMNDELGK